MVSDATPTTESHTFPLRAFPRRLQRSLLGFAAAGTFFALLVWSDHTNAWQLALTILIAAWGIPALFAWQIYSTGFDPITRMVATPNGLEAYFREGGCRFNAWNAMRRLVIVEGFRHQSWAILTDDSSIRWFGELEDPEGFMRLVSERTGLNWERTNRLPAQS